MKGRDGVLLELNSEARQLRARFFSFVALITVVIVTAGLTNYFLHATNEQLESANRLNQELFTNLQQISEKFRFITTRGKTVSPRTLEFVRKDLLRLTSAIQQNQQELQQLLDEKKLNNSLFWPDDLFTQSMKLTVTEQKVIDWLHKTTADLDRFFDKESLRLTRPLESAVLLQNPWHIRLVETNEQFNKHIQSNFKTTRFVIWTTFLGLFFILWMMYSAIIRPALFRLQHASNRSQAKIDLQTALAAFMEDVSNKGAHLFDNDIQNSKILNQLLHKHQILKQCELDMSNDCKSIETSLLVGEKLLISEQVHHKGAKAQHLCMQLPTALSEFEKDIAPFLKALANHLSALFEISLRMTAESQRDTYYQIADTAINALPTPVVVFDESQQVMLMNPAFQSFFPDIPHSTSSNITLHELALHNNTLISSHTDNSGNIFVEGSYAEFSVSYSNDKNVVWSRLPVNKLGMVFIGHDITTIRDDLTEKEHTHRLEYLGQMSVSVAHDTNNHLAIIMNILEIIGLRADLTEDSQVLLQEAINSCQKASSISRQMVSFSRRQNLVPTTILPSVVGKYVELFLFEKSFKNVLLSIDLEEDACIFCDPEHLKSTIINIVRNSVEAMHAEGMISLSIHSMNTYMVCITISDSGPGFTSSDFEKATDPFYTTKDGAAGLGLAGAHGFTRQSNGSLSLQNNINAGATIELHLPKSHIAMSDHWDEMATQENSELHTKGLSILLIEDNEMLSDLMIIEFERVGYEVHSANTVEEGLEGLKEIEKIDVLVTDIILPDGLGFRVAQQLNDHFPRTEVVYITGYGSEEYTSELKKNPGRVLEKPFSILKLISLVELSYKQALTNNLR